MGMHNYARFVGILLIAVGGLYFAKPDLFKRGVWKKTDIAQRLLSPEGYNKYMRLVGLVNVIIGIVLLVWSWASN
jgi:hypothetical protein